ncbi:hypothetical protein GGS23DRAFT_552874, partial [Durotheca rogersii]|uniref:uncharacterized protein n=1 Tax=Durotheca rogersii TaxID=419775 RepID=UPI00222084F5
MQWPLQRPLLSLPLLPPHERPLRFPPRSEARHQSRALSLSLSSSLFPPPSLHLSLYQHTNHSTEPPRQTCYFPPCCHLSVCLLQDLRFCPCSASQFGLPIPPCLSPPFLITRLLFYSHCSSPPNVVKMVSLTTIASSNNRHQVYPQAVGL